MKKIFFYLSAILLGSISNNSAAQALKTPQLSTTQTITQEIGLGKISLTYARPNVRARKIFGGVEPYGTIWRTGANAATTISFSEDVTIEGNKIPAGDYALFSIPGVEEWTIIISKKADQWGAYKYQQADDLLRFKVRNIKLSEPMETMTMQFYNVDQTKCIIEMKWEASSFAFAIQTDVDAKVMANIANIMDRDNKPYFEAAVYYYENNKDLNKALEWIRTPQQHEKRSAFYKLWEARILLKMGRKSDALTAALHGAQYAKEGNDKEYERLNTAVAEQAKP